MTSPPFSGRVLTQERYDFFARIFHQSPGKRAVVAGADIYHGSDLEAAFYREDADRQQALARLESLYGAVIDAYVPFDAVEECNPSLAF